MHQKVLLVYGQIADPNQSQFDGTIWVCHHQDSFPATSWPVCDSHFKILVHLQPGPNRIRLDFVSPRLPTPNGAPAHSSWININYLPQTQNPPLELLIVMAKDSPGTYDATPDRKQREGNGLEMAIRKFKMMAYLWAAFTGEQMNRHGFGRRCFHFDEQWQLGTLSSRDAEAGSYRSEAKVHVHRIEMTLAELRDVEIAQQNHKASRGGDLFGIGADAAREYFKIKPGKPRYVAVMFLDSHWDTHAQLVRAHAALGGGGGELWHAVFGSHALHSYPSCLEEVVPAFTDCTKTDTNFVANDLNESGSSWEAANIGIGAHMHEVGHLLGCPHQESGVMLRDYVNLNRTFTTREPYSTRTQSAGKRLCLQQDECAWHRLDVLRFRFHPCLALPNDPMPAQDSSVQVWSIDGNVLMTAPSGVAWLEMRTEGEEKCFAYIEYTDGSRAPPTQTVVSENELRGHLRAEDRRKKLRVEVFSAGGGSHVIEDFGALNSKESRVKLPNGQTGFRSGKLGFSVLEGSQAEETIFWYAVDQKKLLTNVRVFSGMALDGIEFMYEDSTSQLFGKRGGSAADFPLDTRRGEVVLGFHLRAGAWIDGVQILTSAGRRSGWFGKSDGGSG